MSTSQVPERLIAYVDGFNLYHGLHEAASHQWLWLDLVALVQALRPKQTLVQVKYFTASVLGEPAAQSRQDTYIAALEAKYPHLFTKTMGRYQQKTKICRHCAQPWHMYEEKETDVNIAVNLVADAAARKAESFMVLSADSDIAPAVRMAQSLNPQAFFFAAFPPKRFSAELKTLMPASFHIGPGRIKNSMLPPSVTAADGKVHQQPLKWT